MGLESVMTVVGLGVAAYIVYYIMNNGGAAEVAASWWDKFLNGV